MRSPAKVLLTQGYNFAIGKRSVSSESDWPVGSCNLGAALMLYACTIVCSNDQTLAPWHWPNTPDLSSLKNKNKESQVQFTWLELFEKQIQWHKYSSPDWSSLRNKHSDTSTVHLTGVVWETNTVSQVQYTWLGSHEKQTQSKVQFTWLE